MAIILEEMLSAPKLGPIRQEASVSNFEYLISKLKTNPTLSRIVTSSDYLVSALCRSLDFIMDLTLRTELKNSYDCIS